MKIIKNEKDYEKALSKIEQLIDIDPQKGSEQADYLEILTLLVEKYEDEYYQIDLPDPLEAIKFRMDQENLTQRDLIPLIGSRTKVSEVLNRRRPLTLKMIRALNKQLGISAEVLLNEPKAQLLDELSSIQWEKDFPLVEMFKRGCFPGYSKITDVKENAEELIRDLLSILNGHELKFELRQNIRKGSELNVYALIVWKALVFRKATAKPLPGKFNRVNLKKSFFEELIRFSVKSNGPISAKTYLINYGIHLIVEPHFKKTHLDGASFQLHDGAPVVALTLRHDRMDNFWFTLFHELAHIKLHFEKDNYNNSFIDNLDVRDNSKIEKEADALAERSIIDKKMWGQIYSDYHNKKLDIEGISKKFQRHKSIIAGRIRKEEQNYRLFSRLITDNKVRSLFN